MQQPRLPGISAMPKLLKTPRTPNGPNAIFISTDLPLTGMVYGERRRTACAVIPAFNEAETVSTVVKQTAKYVDSVILVDDFSTDATCELAKKAGANVLRNGLGRGAHYATLFGIQKAVGFDDVVTLDADGQHPADCIPRLIDPILSGEADFVIGRRVRIPPSERILGEVVSKILAIENRLDVGSGLRVFKRTFLRDATPEDIGYCSCGSLVLYAYLRGARIGEMSFRLLPRRAGSSKFSNIQNYALHKRPADFLSLVYGPDH